MTLVVFNHVGIGVSDIHAGVEFYKAVFACRVIKGPFSVEAEGPGGERSIDVLKSRKFGRMLMAHLALADNVGIEIFQLIDPPHEPRQPQLEYWKSGTFHFCLTDGNLEERVKLLIEHGGFQLSKIWLIKAPDKRIVYCADPWGTIIEIYSHSYVDMCSD